MAEKNEKKQKKITPRERILIIVDEIKKNGYSRAGAFAVAPVEARMSAFAFREGVNLANGYMYMSAKSISHSMRASKVKMGINVPPEDIALFPERHSRMLLFFDGEAFIYTDMRYKYIVHPSYEIKVSRKKEEHVNFITAGVVTDPKEFTNRKYRIVF